MHTLVAIRVDELNALLAALACQDAYPSGIPITLSQDIPPVQRVYNRALEPSENEKYRSPLIHISQARIIADMHVVVIGAGPTGLLTYLALQTHLGGPGALDSTTTLTSGIFVKVVDSAQGVLDLPNGSSSFSPNALRAIAAISPELLSRLRAKAYSGGIINILNSQGSILGEFKAGTKQKYGEELQQLVVSDKVFRDVILETIKLQEEEVVVWGKAVAGLHELSSGGVRIEYEDGTVEVADLVIGADGPKSMVKDFIFKGDYQTTPSGPLTVGGFIPTSQLPLRFQEDLKNPNNQGEARSSAITFGKRGFVGYSLIDSPIVTGMRIALGEKADHDKAGFQGGQSILYWWSVFFPQEKETDSPATIDEIRSQFLHRVEGWKAPFDSKIGNENAYEDILRLAFHTGAESLEGGRYHIEKPLAIQQDEEQSGLIIHPRYRSPRLPRLANSTSQFSKGRLVLVGEAAHVIPPETLQNVAFTVEDIAVYVLLLKAYSDDKVQEAKASIGEDSYTEKSLRSALGSDGNSVFEAAAKAYDALRLPRINSFLKDVGGGMDECDGTGEMGWLGEKLRDLAASFFCKISECVLEKSFGYDPKGVVDDYISRNRR